jgi:NADPH-dependent ferric siderophore reductase
MVSSERKRTPKRAVVERITWLSPAMVRLHFGGADLRDLEALSFTDSYIKILFPPAAADYRWPFDPAEIRDTRPAELWPVTRTYTIRSHDPIAAEMAVDFVVHGEEGLAGPWAASARPGAEIGVFGPGGGYAPDPTAAAHLLVGDEAAIPAIAASLARLPQTARADVYLEVANGRHRQSMPGPAGARVTWVSRNGRPYGQALAEAVRSADLPLDNVQVFVHGNADLVRDLRRYLYVDRRVDRSRVSISGYWRTGHTEDRWQSTKRDFAAQMESEEAGAISTR